MGHVVEILSRANGFDTNKVITGAYAACAVTSHSKSFVGRYIPKANFSPAGDLSAEEAVGITENGLAILVVQHPRGGSFSSNAAATAQGTADGNEAVSYASSIDAPNGTFIYCDAEAFDTFAHGGLWAKAWAAAVLPSVYKAAYYGDQTILNLTTGVTWHGLWENVTNMGALTGANVSQLAHTTLSCDTSIGIDGDTMLTSLGGFWGF